MHFIPEGQEEDKSIGLRKMQKYHFSPLSKTLEEFNYHLIYVLKLNMGDILPAMNGGASHEEEGWRNAVNVV